MEKFQGVRPWETFVLFFPIYLIDTPTQSVSCPPRPRVTPWNIDDALCDVIGCYHMM